MPFQQLYRVDVISFLFLVVCFDMLFAVEAQNGVMESYGGSVLAMAGKNCVALAVDKRFGLNNALINTTPRSVLLVPDHVMVAFVGLEGGVQALRNELSAQIAAKYSRGLGFGRHSSIAVPDYRKSITASAMAFLTSHVLYRHRNFFVEPLIVGLQVDAIIDTNLNKIRHEHIDVNGDAAAKAADTSVSHRRSYRPYLCSMDMIGAKSESDAFVCAGVAAESLFGTAEALWKPELSEEELLEVCSKAFLSALERNCLSGYGAVIYLITPEKGITEYDLVGRSD